MSALTSLLVRDRVVPVSKIEEALQSQVFLGGDLEIILLEMNLVPEDVLSAYRAALFNLLPATREEVMRASREALRRVSPELARAVGMVPLLFEKRTLVVAAWEPIYEPRLGELEAQLGCELSVRIVNGARLAAGLAHQYGFELDPRLRRLADALRRRDPGVVPYVHPPTPSVRPSMPPSAPLDDDGDGEPSEDDLEPSPHPERHLPDEPAESYGSNDGDDEDAYVDLEAERAATPRGVSPELVHLVRAPFAYESALALLQKVTQRDDVLFVLLRYVQQFFGFTCIFGVGRDNLSARMAHGAGLPPDLVEQALIDAPRVGLFAQAVREARPLLGSFGDAHEEHEAAELLQRPPGRVGLVLPVVLSGRVVLVVYVDAPLARGSARSDASSGFARGSARFDAVHEEVTLAHAELVTPMLPAVNEALYRIIIEQRNQRIAESLQAEARSEAARQGGAHELPQVTPEAAPLPRSDLRAIDLDRLEQAASHAAAPYAPRVAGDSPEAARLRERLPGVPRPAPTPPGYAAVQARAIGYGQRGGAGLAEERLAETPPRGLASMPPPSGVAEGREAVRERRADEHARGAVGTPADVSSSAGSRAGDAADAVASERERSSADASGVDGERPPIGDAAAAVTSPAEQTSEVDAASASAPLETPEPAARSEQASPHAGADVPARMTNGAGKAQGGASGSVQVASSVALNDVANTARERPSQVDESVEPSVIIDMGESVDVLVDALEKAPPRTDAPEIDELLGLGEGVLPVLMQRFPGPLWFDRRSPHRQRPASRDVSAVARAISAFGERAAPYLGTLLGDHDSERAYYALLLARDIVHPELVEPVARHVLDPDPMVRALAVDVLRDYAGVPQYEVVLRALADLAAHPSREPGRQLVSVEALGGLRDGRTLVTLLGRLRDSDAAIVQAAHRALVVLTGHDFGSSARKWESWAEGWGRAHRVEWLIEALLHTDESVRSLAGEELKRLTQQYFGYHPALPRRDRELAQRKYREWWELEGRVAFGR